MVTSAETSDPMAFCSKFFSQLKAEELKFSAHSLDESLKKLVLNFEFVPRRSVTRWPEVLTADILLLLRQPSAQTVKELIELGFSWAVSGRL